MDKIPRQVIYQAGELYKMPGATWQYVVDELERDGFGRHHWSTLCELVNIGARSMDAKLNTEWLSKKLV